MNVDAAVLAVIVAAGFCSARHVMTRLGLERTAALYIIRKLAAAGDVVAIGSTRDRVWFDAAELARLRRAGTTYRLTGVVIH